ncbi:histidine phosphatase family protein [Clostridium manihotivorum]|uniref:Histidine phosphatase family protein n=1 Tax=Clostridium manihotivorum TaxID=2320868 RepID=A0A410DPD8_9CLOT|nr:histidine phosphatase family protein [Clostridium manihotivorum]QAA30931.1 histidine phosphatase family protein [Clostridium manihotivorum]
MIDLVVVRHGQSGADLENKHEGRADFQLTTLGVQQAEKAAKWLKDKITFDYIFSSPLKRASVTAEIIAQRFNIKVLYDDLLMEYNNGVLAGLDREDAERLYPLPKGGRKYYDRIEAGESAIELRARAEEFLARLIDALSETQEDKRVLIVAHGGIINMLFNSFLNLPISSNVIVNTGDTGIHFWRIRGKERIILKSNIQEHLL